MSSNQSANTWHLSERWMVTRPEGDGALAETVRTVFPHLYPVPQRSRPNYLFAAFWVETSSVEK